MSPLILMRAITALVGGTMIGVLIAVGLIYPVIVYHDSIPTEEEYFGGDPISWRVPLFDGHKVTGHARAYTYTDLDEDDFYRAMDSGFTRHMVNDWGFSSIPDCPDGFIDALERTVRYAGGDMRSYDDWQLCVTISAFVRDGIHYRYDDELYGCTDYAATPTETLYLGEGDCEDVSILFVSIARAYGIDSTVLSFEEHCTAGVRIDGFKGRQVDGYSIVECTESYFPVVGLWSPRDLGDGKAVGLSWEDDVVDLWAAYCDRTLAYNPILFIYRMLS